MITLNEDDKLHYQNELDTAKLVRESYIRQCNGSKLTPEKTYALCQLTWWSKKENRYWEAAKLPAIWSLWNKNALPPSIESLEELENYGFQSAFLNYAIPRTGFTNFYTAYRNSSKIWISKNFNVIRPLIHKAANLKNDEQAEDLMRSIENLPGIPMANHSEKKMKASSLLTPLFACLDPRLRFPIINNNNGVIRLHRKLGIAHSSLSDRFETLTSLIGQQGIKNTLMLDVVNYKIPQLKTVKSDGVQLKKSNIESKNLNKKDDFDVEIIAKSRSNRMTRLHNSMTNSLMGLCRINKLQIFEGPDSNKYDALIENYNGKKKDLLLEVKSATDRSHLRLAVGQLFDYRRKLERRFVTEIAILLPNKPSKDDIAFLDDVGVHVLWFINQRKALKSNLNNFELK